MRESEYTRAVDRLLPPSVYHLKLHLSYTSGVADSWYSGSRADLWVEWKYVRRVPPRLDLCSGRAPIISRLQQHWLSSRNKEGRNVAVIVGSPDGAVIFPDLTWKRGIGRGNFRRFMQDKHAVAAWITQVCVGRYGTTEMLPVDESIPLAASDASPITLLPLSEE